ncbi:MAG: sulfatase, partial [Planctomycetota bacterium]
DAPNLVLVVIDTLRSDRLSAYGYARPTSPNLTALATRGVLWSDAWSVAPWTWPSTASILTGLEPPEHGVLNRFSCHLPETAETLAERLLAAGFATAAVSTNPLISPGQNFQQGFLDFELRPWARATEALPLAEAALERMADERFFLYLHLTDPHLPFEPEPEHAQGFVESPAPEGFVLEELETQVAERDAAWGQAARAYTSDLYDAEVAAADAALGRLFAALARLDLNDQTLIVVTSDHGEELFEHGRLGHSHQLFRESLSVPLVAAGPGLPTDQRIDDPVQNVRLLPSVLAWLDLDADPDLPLALPLTPGRPKSLHFSTEVGSWPGERDSARLLARREDDRFTLWSPSRAEVALYDLAADPDETVNIAADRPVVAQRQVTRIDRWWSTREVARPGGLAGGADTEAMLRRLGYLEDD